MSGCEKLPLWYIIARNEYRLMTSGKVLRRLRPVIPVALISGIIILAAVMLLVSKNFFVSRLNNYFKEVVMMPMLASTSIFLQDSVYVLNMGSMAGAVAFMIPIFAAIGRQLQEAEVVSRDVILASPLKARHVLLGDFIVNLIIVPVVLIIASFMMIPAAITFYLTPQAIALIFASIAIANLSGIWIGVMISSYLYIRETTERMKTLFKTLLGVAGVAMGIGFFFLSSSTMPLNLWFLPSTWVGNVVHFAVTQSNIAIAKINYFYIAFPVYPDGWTSLALLVLFTFLVVLAGVAYASKVSFIETGGEEVTVMVKGENWFYRAIRKITPTPLNIMLVSQLKEFARRMDNMARVATVLVFPAIIFLMRGIMQTNVFQGDVGWISFFSSFTGVYIMMAGVLLPIMIVPYTFVRNKDVLWTIKKTPAGVKLMVHAMFLEALILSTPLAVISAVMFYLALGGMTGNPATVLATMLFLVAVSSAITVGVYAWRPVFQERGIGHLINFLITMILTGITTGVMLILSVVPWVLNLIPSMTVLNGIPWLPPSASIVLAFMLVHLEPVSVPVRIAGIAVSLIVGGVAAYLALKKGVEKLEAYE